MHPNSVPRPADSLANMRAQGVRSLWVVCELCHHEAVLNVDRFASRRSGCMCTTPHHQDCTAHAKPIAFQPMTIVKNCEVECWQGALTVLAILVWSAIIVTALWLVGLPHVVMSLHEPPGHGNKTSFAGVPLMW